MPDGDVTSRPLGIFASLWLPLALPLALPFAFGLRVLRFDKRTETLHDVTGFTVAFPNWTRCIQEHVEITEIGLFLIAVAGACRYSLVVLAAGERCLVAFCIETLGNG